MSREVGSEEWAREGVVRWWREHQRVLSWRQSRDPWAILVAEVMSQQTPVARALPRWEEWMARWPTPAACAQAPLAEVLAFWQGMGYPRRARALWESAGIISREGWPERLEDLPGVGEYTAAAVACFAHEEDVLPLDTNVRRVLARRFPSGVMIPPGEGWEHGQAMIEFGQRLCRPTPVCAECPVAQGCSGAAAIRAGSDPAPRPRRQAPYAGSFRQRRGAMLRQALQGERPLVSADPDVAASLIADGLVRRHGRHLDAP